MEFEIPQEYNPKNPKDDNFKKSILCMI